MEVLKTITEYLLKKQWWVFLVSVLAGIIGIIVVPRKWIDSLPFSSNDVNTAILLIAISIITYIIISSAKYIIQRYRNHKKALIINKEKAEKHKKSEEDIIEKTKKIVDGWSDYEYSVVMYLLENENQKPFVPKSYRTDAKILNNDKIFNMTSISGYAGKQYLLTKPVYEDFKIILEETGNISHFQKKRVDIGQ